MGANTRPTWRLLSNPGPTFAASHNSDWSAETGLAGEGSLDLYGLIQGDRMFAGTPPTGRLDTISSGWVSLISFPSHLVGSFDHPVVVPVIDRSRI